MNDKTNNSNRQPSFKMDEKPKRFNRGENSNNQRSNDDRNPNRGSNDRRGDSRTNDRRFSNDRRSNEGRSNDNRDSRNSNRDGERRNDERRDNKFSKPRSSNGRRRDDRSEPKSSFNWPTNGNFAGKSKQGTDESTSHSVPVKVKGYADRNEKKGGALSPRAPEKIRKNRNEEMKVYGEMACVALFAERPESIVRLWLTIEAAKKFPELMSYLAANKKAYHVVDTEEMNLVCGGEHHNGICLLVKKKLAMTLSGYLKLERNRDCLVWVDGIQNGYNLGGIMRTCAYFGAKGVISNDMDNLLSPVAMRVAEGGAEHIYPLQISGNKKTLEELKKAGYQIIVVSENKQVTPFNNIRLADKIVFVISEDKSSEEGFSPFTQTVLSFENPLNSVLNSAVKTGVLLSRWYFR